VTAEKARLEWQAAEGSYTLHVIDTLAYAKPSKSGPRALCGKYPQRNREHPWWALAVSEVPDRPGMNLSKCADCEASIPPASSTPEEASLLIAEAPQSVTPLALLCAEEHPDDPDRTCTRTAWDCDGDHAFPPGSQDGA
jgi:hypothetical protein